MRCEWLVRSTVDNTNNVLVCRDLTIVGEDDESDHLTMAGDEDPSQSIVGNEEKLLKKKMA